MAGAAAPLSLAATGLSAFSSISSGDTAANNARIQAQNAVDQASQTNQADMFRAQQLSDAAAYGRTQALQTDTDMRLQLADKLANINVVRGAANVDSNSPTGAALANRTEEVADINRQQTVQNIVAQNQQDRLGAAYYAQAGAAALAIGQTNSQMYLQNADDDQTGGFLGAIGKGLSGLAGLKFS